MSIHSSNFPDWKDERAYLASAEVTERADSSSPSDESLAASDGATADEESRESIKDRNQF